MDRRFDIIFGGRLVEGKKPAEVLNNLCTVLELEEAQVRELFKAGAGAVIKKDLDSKAAFAWQEQLREAGVICKVKELPPPPPPEELSGSMQSINTPPVKPRQRVQDLKPNWQPPVMPPKQGPGMFTRVFQLILLAGVVAGGWWVYQTWFAKPTPAFTAYAGYAEALAREQYQKAVDGSLGEARGYAESRIQMSRGSSIKVYGREINTSPPSISSIAGEVTWIKHKKKLEQKKSDTAVELQVEETVCRIPPGVTSALCKWPVTFQHDVEVQLEDGIWRVSGFKETRLTPYDK